MPAAAKRKRNAKDDGSAPKKGKMGMVARREFHNHYYQGVDTLELEGCGLGSYLFGSPDLTFHSPLDEPMWFEIMSGQETGDKAISSIHFRGHGKGLQDILAPSFILPFPHIEQFIIVDAPETEACRASSGRAYRVIIVPTAAVGASPLKRTYPQIIHFRLPDQKVGVDFKGIIGEANDDPDETYRSLITRVINEHLAPYQKTVIDASSDHDVAEDASPAMISYDVVLKHEADETDQSDAKNKGQLFFLKTGILFHSPTTVLYLTSKSTPAGMLIHNFEGSNRKEPTNLSLICPTSEPYYESNQETKKGKSARVTAPEPVFITFNGIDRDLPTSIAEHAKKHGMELSELEQSWYSLEKEQPMTGWMPRCFGM